MRLHPLPPTFPYLTLSSQQIPFQRRHPPGAVPCVLCAACCALRAALHQVYTRCSGLVNTVVVSTLHAERLSTAGRASQRRRQRSPAAQHRQRGEGGGPTAHHSTANHIAAAPAAELCTRRSETDAAPRLTGAHQHPLTPASSPVRSRQGCHAAVLHHTDSLRRPSRQLNYTRSCTCHHNRSGHQR